ncbi:receptor-like kinase TMK2 [Primulina tabacum]|uniref:receptor-like kinase TMK2 n=1 Tax=Primulina tabacum TaxID=48773 RepID=UPI003F5AC147
MECFADKIFIHKDLKPSNILLGDDMRAKVANFGLVWHVPLALDGEASAASKVVGTFGYIALECACSLFIYCFDVILMELITVRYALDISLTREKQHIVAWFRSMLISRGTYAFPNAIDPNLDLSEEKTLSSIITVLELVDYCSSRVPNQRHCMSHVVYVLLSLAGVWKPTKCADP